MKSILFTIAIIISTLGFSQKQDNKSVFKVLEKGETLTITMNTSNFSPSKIGELKDQLIGMYDEKVFDVTYNESDQLFSFTYNEFMQKEDLILLFEKNNISSTSSDITFIAKENK
jgi:hypothetical protein